LTVWAERRLRKRLPSQAFRAIQALWRVAALALFAAPLLTVYALRTTGQWHAPAPGLVGFRAARWFTLGRFRLLVAGAALAAVVQWRADDG
jgi:hypothetical protein